jgi:hypothetical protein
MHSCFDLGIENFGDLPSESRSISTRVPVIVACSKRSAGRGGFATNAYNAGA